MIRKSQLNLVKHTDSVLLSPTQPFDFKGDIDADMLANMMFDRMKELGGIGLSANQVGLNVRMFVMGIDDLKMAIFNPVITKVSQQEVVLKEGCLSFPGMFVLVKRPEEITVEFYNVRGELKQVELKGLTARVFLHEYDHMEGVTMNTRVSKLKWDLAKRKLQNKKNKIVEKHSKQVLSDLSRSISRP